MEDEPFQLLLLQAVGIDPGIHSCDILKGRYRVGMADQQRH